MVASIFIVYSLHDYIYFYKPMCDDALSLNGFLKIVNGVGSAITWIKFENGSSEYVLCRFVLTNAINALSMNV